MSGKKFVGWRRVSTTKQRGSHLGLEAQKSIIDFFVEREKGELIADYEECHSGTDLAGCTELKKAKEHCKRTGATLIIAKTDRCRDTVEALQLYEEMNGKIYFCDLPHTDKFTLTLLFSLAEREATIVSLRTKQALKAKKARNEQTGGTNELWGSKTGTNRDEVLEEVRRKSAEVRRQRMLNEPSNKFIWTYTQSQIKNGRRFFTDEEFEQLACELNALERKTPTGMEYNKNRAKAQYYKIKKAMITI